MISEIQFGPWLADATDYKNPGLEVCTNCIPSPSGYQPVYAASGSGATVTGTIIGAETFIRSDGTLATCCATTSDLYVIIGGTANASSLSLSLSTSDRVVFEQFNSEVYATTKDGDTWYLTDIDTDTTFAAVSGTIPSANAIGRVRDFLVMGDYDDGTDYPFQVSWSPFNNPSGTWGTDVATQTDFQPLDPQHGPVTAISGGSFGLVFQRSGISRMTYVGGARVFDFDLYEKNRGCVAPQSVARVGDIAYYLSYDGFFRTDGASVQSISQGRIWAWFLDNSNQANIELVTAAIDFERRCVVWFFMASDTSVYNGQLWYNWETERWSYVNQTAEFGVLTQRGTGTTLEQLASTYPDLDAMMVSLDDESFRPSGRTMGAFVGNELSAFTGASLSPLLTTGSFQFSPGQRQFIRGIAPLLANDNEDTTVAVAVRDAMTKSFVTTPSVAVGTAGYAPVNADGRYFRVTTEVPAGSTWSDAYGLQVEYSRSGAT